MSQPIRFQDGHLFLLTSPKNTNLVEDVEIVLPVNFYWIPFGSFREEVKNVSANQRPGRPSCFSDQKMTNKRMVVDIEILLPVKFRLIPFSGFRGEVENVSANQRLRWPSCLSHRPEKHKLDRGHWDCVSCQISLNFTAVAEKESKIYQPIRGGGGHFVFKIGLKRHKLGRGCWDIASCEVSFNSIQQFQQRSWKCLSQLEAMAAILYFRLARKTQTW